MVADTADGDGDAVHFADETADVGEHLAKVFVAYLHAMVLDMEYDVDVVFTSELPMVIEFVVSPLWGCARVAPPLVVGSSFDFVESSISGLCLDFRAQK